MRSVTGVVQKILNRWMTQTSLSARCQSVIASGVDEFIQLREAHHIAPLTLSLSCCHCMYALSMHKLGSQVQLTVIAIAYYVYR